MRLFADVTRGQCGMNVTVGKRSNYNMRRNNVVELELEKAHDDVCDVDVLAFRTRVLECIYGLRDDMDSLRIKLKHQAEELKPVPLSPPAACVLYVYVQLQRGSLGISPLVNPI